MYSFGLGRLPWNRIQAPDSMATIGLLYLPVLSFMAATTVDRKRRNFHHFIITITGLTPLRPPSHFTGVILSRSSKNQRQQPGASKCRNSLTIQCFAKAELGLRRMREMREMREILRMAWRQNVWVMCIDIISFIHRLVANFNVSLCIYRHIDDALQKHYPRITHFRYHLETFRDSLGLHFRPQLRDAFSSPSLTSPFLPSWLRQ